MNDQWKDSEQLIAGSKTGPMTLLFAVSVGVIVTNLYAPQTLVGLIGPSLGVAMNGSGLVAMATLLGYAVGLFLLVPLADLLENRKLVVTMLLFAVAAAVAAALAPTAALLLIVLFILGASCSTIQILVPFAAFMVAPERRGRVIGDVMGGVMVGIIVARSLASLIADTLGWRAFYGLSAIAMAVLTSVLAARLPQRRPDSRSGYIALIASLGRLLGTEPVLRQRALTASLVMAAFSLFWTSIALRLAQRPFEFGQRGIALFALAGASTAIATPIFGRMGDHGWSRPAIFCAHLVLIGALALAGWAGSYETVGSVMPLAAMALSAVLLGVAATGDHTLGRRAISLLQPAARGRLNGLFVGLIFLGGGLGSAMAGVAWSGGGWAAICLFGIALGTATLVADSAGIRTG
jgi:predicted MFS family arabinose efflux permease